MIKGSFSPPTNAATGLRVRGFSEYKFCDVLEYLKHDGFASIACSSMHNHVQSCSTAN